MEEGGSICFKSVTMKRSFMLQLMAPHLGAYEQHILDYFNDFFSSKNNTTLDDWEMVVGRGRI